MLLVIATSAAAPGLNWGGSSYPWSSPQVLGLLALSAVFWIAFATRLSRAKEPLVSLEVLSNPIVLAGCFGMFMVAAANVGLSVYLPVYAQAYLGLSPAGSGYALLGFLLGAVAGATLGGRLIAALGACQAHRDHRRRDRRGRPDRGRADGVREVAGRARAGADG